MKFFIIFTFLSFSLSLPIMAGTLPSVSLQTPIVGIDYPTDVPTHHAGKVLVIQNERVLVPISSQLVKSEAGTD